jgi:hypothetical protein
MIKIALASDLHLEIAPITLTNTDGADVLILSGDIMTAVDLHDHPTPDPNDPVVIPNLGRKQATTKMFREFLANVSKEFPKVVYVAGNHEYYRGKYPDVIHWLKDELINYPNIHLLNNSTFEVGDYTFLGGTLWTDMNKGDPTTIHLIENLMNDFRAIRNSKQNYRRFLPKDAVAEHNSTVNFIKNTIDTEPNKKYVVVGHHAPSALSVHEMYRNEYHMNGGYYSDLSEMILDRPQIKLWTHGHMHNNSDYMIGDTRVVCNPRGYGGHEVQAATWQLQFIEVD